MRIRSVVGAVLGVLLIGVTPLAGGAEPVGDADAPLALAHRVWYSDLGTGVDGMALEPVTGRAFVRQDATVDGADLAVVGPGTDAPPIVLPGPYGHPVAANGSIFVLRAGKLRRIDPTSLAETGAWSVPDLTADLPLATAGGDIVWTPRQSSEPSSAVALVRFDPDTGSTAISGAMSGQLRGPVGGGDALVAWVGNPARLVSFDGVTAGPLVDVSDRVASIYRVDVSDDGALVTVPDFSENRAVEFSLPGFVPTGIVYETDVYPILSASTTAGGGALAVLSVDDGSPNFSLQVFARGNPEAVVEVVLPPTQRVPQVGDLAFSADGTKLFYLVGDRPDHGDVARLVVADLGTTVSEPVEPMVVGTRGGAVAAVTASLGTGTTLTLAGEPVATTIEVGPLQPLGETHDRISFTVPAMDPGPKPIVLTNALGHPASAGSLHVVDLGPFANAPWFARQQIGDITGKPATDAQVDALLDRFVHGATAGEVIAGLQADQGQATTRAALIRLYRAVFLRPPDTGGLQYWLGRMQGGTRLVQVAATFAGSSEFQRRYGTLSNGAFVDRIYQNVLGRPADPGGRTYWIRKINAGTSRGVLVAQFAQSDEYVRKSTGDVQRIELRLAMLGKTPTEAQLAPLRGMDFADVAWQFLNDPNYSTN